MQEKKALAIGDAANNEERLLQDRIVRILSYSVDENDVMYLYFNDTFREGPPSSTLFNDEDDLSQILANSYTDNNNQSKGQHAMFPKLVSTQIIEQRGDNSYYVEDIVTRVYLPSEEFAQVIELSPAKRFCSRLWNWCKGRATCR